MRWWCRLLSGVGEQWVARRAGANGVVSVNWQQVCLGAAAAGHNIDVHVSEEVMQFWDGDELLRTARRERPGPVPRDGPRSPAVVMI